MEYTIEDVSTKIAMMSLVGIHGEYPRGRGNYISTGDGMQKEGTWIIVNVSGEDLEDAVRLGVVGKTMKAKVWRGPGHWNVAYVIDERLPGKARSCWHFYNMPSMVAVKVMREVGQVAEGTCICNTEQFMTRALFGGRYSYTPNGYIRIGKCGECKQERSVEIKRETT